jgi:hypothetical protein
MFGDAEEPGFVFAAGVDAVAVSGWAHRQQIGG